MKRLYIPLFLLMLVLFVSCKPEEPLVKQDFALATVVKITLRDHATEELMDRLFARLREIEGRMSTQEKQSDIYKLNHALGEALQVHEDTYYVIQRAKEYYELTGGYFDPTLGSVVELWKIGTEEAAIPSSEELEKALAQVDGSQIELLDNLQVRIPEGVVLDLGAIAKGYAADEVAKIAREEGVTSAIFDLGGNVLTLGDKEGKKFRIGIQEPFSEVLRGSPFAILLLSDQTVVTSGDYEQFFEEDGKRYHHIIDFRTGYPVENELACVSIITDSSIRADALGTAVYAMGMEKGKTFIESQENLEAIFVTRNKKVTVTTGLSESFILEDSSYHQE